MEDKEFNQLLKTALSTDFEPDLELNTIIIRKAREKERMKVIKMKRFPVVAAICFVLLFCSGTAFAAWKYLKPADIAVESGDKQLAAAFESKDAILMEESQSYGEYTVTLLGTVSGNNLSDFCSGDDQVNSGKTYAVVAISKKDGTPMPEASSDPEEYNKVPFFVSPLIQGLDPKDYNIVTMNGGYFEIVKNGIRYRMIECDNIELFSNRNLYLCVSNTNFYDHNAYKFDEKTGDISVNSSYKGMNLLFNLHLNKDKADEKAAKEYLEKLALSQSPDSQEETVDEKTAHEETKEAVDIDEIIHQWTLVSEKKVTPGEDGRVSYSYKTKNGSGDGFITEDALFAKGEVGYSKNINLNEDDYVKHAIIFYRDEKGDVTVSVYEFKK